MNDEGIKRVKRADAALKKLAQDAQQLREAAERRARPSLLNTKHEEKMNDSIIKALRAKGWNPAAIRNAAEAHTFQDTATCAARVVAAEWKRLEEDRERLYAWKDNARWRPIHGDEMPFLGQKVRTWIPHYGESSRLWRGNWDAEETHWRPEAKGPATES